MGVATHRSTRLERGTFSASLPQVHRRLRAVRRGQSRVGRGTGAAAGISRADRPGRDHRREGVDHDSADQVGLGEPGTEAAHSDRRDVRRRGQHQRSGHAAGGRDADPVRRCLRALHSRDAVAGVQLRARPAVGVGAPRASVRFGRTHPCVGRDRRAGVHRHRLAAASGLRARQAGRLLRTHQDRGKQVLRKGLSPLATTISTEQCAPVIAGMRLRAGKTGSGKGAGRMVAQAIATARAVGATGQILVRGDSAYGNRAVVRACLRGNAEFSLVMTKNPAITRAIAAIPDTAWTPVRYPGAVQDPETGAWISDAEVAEVPYTAFAATTDRITARLVVRRVKDARYPDALFPVWRYHPFFTNSTLPTAQADIVHRRHAIIETVFADLIDGPLAHLPSGPFGANSAWVLCAAIAHNLLHTAGILASGPDTAGATPGAAAESHSRARGAPLRRQLITVPARLARLARPARAPVLHLPSRWPWAPA